MSVTARITNKLLAVNQWLLPAIAIAVSISAITAVPWIRWISNEVIDLRGWQENSDMATNKDVVILRAEIAAVIAGLPPDAWKARIIAVEEQQRLSGLQGARIEAILQDVRERVIRLDEQHRGPDKP